MENLRATARLSEHETDRLLDSWAADPGPPASDHARLEIAQAVHEGHEPGDPPPLAEEDPVPGCSCVRCVLLARRASLPEARWAESAVRDLARIDPAARLPAVGLMTEAADDLKTPDPGWLCRRASTLPWAVEPDPPERDDEDPLPVEEARRTGILDVARRLGLGDPRKRGREYVVRCPLHDDNDPSLRLNSEKGPGGVWRCWPCGKGGDGIDLVMSVRDCGFPAAVKWLAGGGRR